MIRWLQRNHHKLRVGAARAFFARPIGGVYKSLGQTDLQNQFFSEKILASSLKSVKLSQKSKKWANTVGQDVQKKMSDTRVNRKIRKQG